MAAARAQGTRAAVCMNLASLRPGEKGVVRAFNCVDDDDAADRVRRWRFRIVGREVVIESSPVAALCKMRRLRVRVMASSGFS